MARHWVVLTADRAPMVSGMIIAYTTWDGYVPESDEVVYTDPIDSENNPVDNNWRVDGSVLKVGEVYTYTEPPDKWIVSASGLLEPAPPPSELELTKIAAFACHGQLLIWSELLALAGITQSSAHVAIGHDILFHGHEGVYLTCNRTDLSYAQKILYCQRTAIGAADVTTPAEFFTLVHTIENSLIAGPVCWVNPETGARLPFLDIPLSTANYFSGLTAPTTIQLSGGDWTGLLT